MEFSSLSVISSALVKQLEIKVVKRDNVIDALIENGKTKEKKIRELEEQFKKLNQQVSALSSSHACFVLF